MPDGRLFATAKFAIVNEYWPAISFARSVLQVPDEKFPRVRAVISGEGDMNYLSMEEEKVQGSRVKKNIVSLKRQSTNNEAVTFELKH